MSEFEKFIFIIGILSLIGLLIYPPVKMNGYSEFAEKWQEYKKLDQLEHQRYGEEAPWALMIPTGNHGKSDSPYINWFKETRHLFFADSNYKENITFLILTEDNTGSKSKAENLDPNSLNEENYETMEGTIKWESHVDIGQLLIEVLLATVITGAIFIFVRF